MKAMEEPVPRKVVLQWMSTIATFVDSSNPLHEKAPPPARLSLSPKDQRNAKLYANHQGGHPLGVTSGNTQSPRRGSDANVQQQTSDVRHSFSANENFRASERVSFEGTCGDIEMGARPMAVISHKLKSFHSKDDDELTMACDVDGYDPKSDDRFVSNEEIDDPYEGRRFVSTTKSTYGLVIFLMKVGWNLPHIVQTATAHGVEGGKYNGKLIKWIEPKSSLIAQFTFVLWPFLILAFVVALTQGTLMWFIWRDLGAIKDSPFCENNTLLHVLVITIVTIQFILQLPDLLRDRRTVMSRRFVMTKEKHGEFFWQYHCQVDQFTKIFAYFVLCLVFIEELLLYVFAIVGIRYVLQQSGAGNIIQACVALQFILEIDNNVYSLLIPDELSEILQSVKFAVTAKQYKHKSPFSRYTGPFSMFLPYHFFIEKISPLLYSQSQTNVEVRDTITFATNNVIQFAFVLSLSLAVVFGLRTDYCSTLTFAQK